MRLDKDALGFDEPAKERSTLKPISWQQRSCDQDQVKKLSQELDISPTFSRILINRNITSSEQARLFLESPLSRVHSPFLLKDMDKAVERILKAIQNKEKIVVYGDYDVDGAVSTSLLYLFFKEIQYPIDYYIPHRMTEGYSLNVKAIEKLSQQGAQLLITVDNGIMAHQEVQAANDIGLDVVITDHHQVGDELPAAVAVVNPQRKDCSYPFKGICGAGVAFKLLMALRQKLREQNYFKEIKEPNLKHSLDLLAVATVCDVVPLVDENRYFVREGLKYLEHTQKLGLRALLHVSDSLGRPLQASDLGFRLGPRINACGRLDQASLGVQLLVSEDQQEAGRLAKQLDDLNKERREIELEIVNESLEQISQEILEQEQMGYVLYHPEWHEGVVGIVASRVVDRFKRPTFVLTKTNEGLVKGSGRSTVGVSLIQALRDCEDILLKFGGHEAAAGVTLTEENLEAFKLRFTKAVTDQVQPGQWQDQIYVDDVLSVDEIDDRLFEELSRLEPYGMGNARPVFATKRIPIQSKKLVGGQHVKLSLKHAGSSLDAIAFRKLEDFESLNEGTGAIFGLEQNFFNNRVRPQMVIREFLGQESSGDRQKDDKKN